MDIVIDLSNFSEFLSQPADVILTRMIFLVGWIPLVIVFLWGVIQIWMDYIGGRWYGTQKFILLAVDVPRDNRQTPKAVEAIFTYLLGAHGTFNLVETYWVGKFQLQFSFEIVSIGGYTQFIIFTPVQFRNLVEAGVYSQYPDAEITEINDYTEEMPGKFPDEDYDLWGSEFILAKSSAYPIKTYKNFEEQGGEEELRFKDPMGSLMSLMSSLEPGEQIWFQILLKPILDDLIEVGNQEIKKIMKEKVAAKKGFIDIILDALLGILSGMGDALAGGEAAPKKEEKKEEAIKMIDLKPKEKKQVESIQEKASKMGYKTKIRYIYIAKKDVMNKPKAVNGFVGFLKQFADLDLNNLKPDMKVTATSASYMFATERMNAKKERIMRAYKGRSMTRGRIPGIMNIEELATLWHFPVEPSVRAPLLQKAPGRKSEAPMALPVEEDVMREVPIDDIFLDYGSLPGASGGQAPGGLSEDVFMPEGSTIIDEAYHGGAGDKEEEPPFGRWEPPVKKPDVPARTASADMPAGRKAEVPTSDGIRPKGAPPPNLPFG